MIEKKWGQCLFIEEKWGRDFLSKKNGVSDFFIEEKWIEGPVKIRLPRPGFGKNLPEKSSPFYFFRKKLLAPFPPYWLYIIAR